jgi:transcriptional regulator with XRE-family HTH domain
MSTKLAQSYTPCYNPPNNKGNTMNVIKKLRLQNNMTQAEFAEKLGLFHNTIGLWEREEHTPTPENIRLLNDTFNTNFSMFDFKR